MSSTRNGEEPPSKKKPLLDLNSIPSLSDDLKKRPSLDLNSIPSLSDDDLKKKKPSLDLNSIPSLPDDLIPSLPDDLIVSCLARVSRLHYPTLSLVSKTFRSLLASPEIYKTRSFLNHKENCLYVCLQFPSDSNPRWFTLCKKPNQTLTTNSSGYALAPIRILNSPTMEWSDLVSVGSNLYAISEKLEDAAPCANISFLDCRRHTWLEAPSLRIAQSHSRFDGNLYLPGSNQNHESLNCIEVFNTKTQTWKPVPSEKQIFKPETMEGKILTKFNAGFSKIGVAYKPKESTWEQVGLDRSSDPDRSCKIENITYSFNYSRGLYWSGTEESYVRRKVKGLEGVFPKFGRNSNTNVKLVDYGGKIMVLWDKYVPAIRYYYKEKMIWCAVISLEKRRNGEEIWGNVEWVDEVLKVPVSYKFTYAIAASV